MRDHHLLITAPDIAAATLSAVLQTTTDANNIDVFDQTDGVVEAQFTEWTDRDQFDELLIWWSTTGRVEHDIDDPETGKRRHIYEAGARVATLVEGFVPERLPELIQATLAAANSADLALLQSAATELTRELLTGLDD
ncbi:hypothetical protein [Agromyces humi]|uniref:hypothetical protein n=1 Tax=Agromyces humi TaxID=1766800 RepID=UPI0013598B71|nr:hypothetical protein [Agromyces humi]